MTKIGGSISGTTKPIIPDTIKTTTALKTDIAKVTTAGGTTANVQTAKTEQKAAAQGQDSVIPRGKTPSDIGEAENRYANAAKQLSLFAAALSDILAKITVEQDGNDRKGALDSRTAARESAKADATEQANKTKEEVEKAKTQATIALVLTIVSAAVQIASSAIEIYGAVKGVPQEKAGGAGQLADLLGDATKNAGPKPA